MFVLTCGVRFPAPPQKPEKPGNGRSAKNLLKWWFSQAGLHPRKGIGSSPIWEQKIKK
nr:MAG TPA: hypothetical protein [Caudoviricetes sp.]